MRFDTVLLIFLFLLVGCGTPGQLDNISPDKNSNIEVYRYWIQNDQAIFIARFKDQPEVQTTTWRDGKTDKATIYVDTTKYNIHIVNSSDTN